MMELPHDAIGWATLIGATTVILTTWIGGALAIGKRYINRTIGDVVRESIDVAMQPVQLQLITMNGELGRVRELEAKMDNGLTQRQVRIEDQVDSLVEHLMWDGRTERRNRE